MPREKNMSLLYLELVCLRANLQQLPDGVNEALVVVVTHALNVSVMIPDPGVQSFHEFSMFISIIYGPVKIHS